MLKKRIVILLLIVISGAGKQSYGQSDSTRHSNKINGNYYAPWHRTIKDTSHRTVSDFGHYLSAGIGGESAYGIGGTAALLSYSLAYKSHLFTLTRAGGATLFTGGAANAIYNYANYFGFLYGESIRLEHVILSLSAGIASANIGLRYPDINNPTNLNLYLQPNYNNIISFPIELKAFGYIHNGIGFGLHISKNILSPSKFSPFYIGFCIVGGYWNKRKK